jgi:hypothetical protein
MAAREVGLTAPKDRWLRAVGYGFLAEVATIITIILVVAVYRGVNPGLPETDYTAFGERAGGFVGLIAGTAFTFIAARLLLRRLSRRFIEHCLVVATAAIALSVSGSIAGHGGVPALYVLASAAKVAAGVLAAYLHRDPALQTARY